MKVPFFDSSAFVLDYKSDLLDDLTNFLESGQYILGSGVSRFEDFFSSVVTTNYTIGVASGLDAIVLSLEALGVSKGDEVITTPVSAYATTLAIQKVGATPVFADIEADSGCVDPRSVVRCISNKTKAIVPVHLYGVACDMSSLCKVASEHQIHVIEDCAQAHLAKHDGQAVGSFGICSAWSFYPTKNLGALGDAGAICTDNSRVAEYCRKIRNYGQVDRYHHELAGHNSRLDELQARFLLTRLGKLRDETMRRQSIAASYYRYMTSSWLSFGVSESRAKDSVYHLFPLTCKDNQGRSELIRYLSDHGIDTLIHYPVPIYKQKAISSGPFRIDPNGTPNANMFCEKVVSIPCNPFMRDEQVSYIINKLNAFTPAY